MKRCVVVLAALLGVLAAMRSAEARGPYGVIKVAGWAGGAFTDDKTGQFTNCIASANYKSGINFGVIVTNTMNWGLAFSHPNWRLAQGQKFPIVLSFDGRNTFDVDGIMMSSNAVLVAMPDNSALIGSFRAAKTMSAFAQGSLFQFGLDGTSILLPALVSCVKTVNAGGIASAGDFTAPLIAAKAAKRAQPPTAASSLQPGIPQEGSAEYQLEAMQIASNFILKASLTHPTILSRSETPASVASTGAAWKADNATGFVRIVPPQPNVTGLEVAAAIVGNDAKDCKGKFASGRNSELVDSEVVFRGMSACEDSRGSVIAEYFIFPRKKGGFILFSVLTPANTMAQQPQGKQREDLNSGFRKAAYVSLGQ
jgi:hypothetical protein